MSQYTQEELHAAISVYVRNKDKLFSDAEKTVVEWKYARCDMFGLLPYFDQVERGSNKWKPAKRIWLKECPSGLWYNHGVDAKGQVQVIRRADQVDTLIVRKGDVVDQVFYGGWAPSMKRYILANGICVAMYHYHLEPHQYTYEEFDYENGCCVKSIEKQWYESDDQWIESGGAICTYEYDPDGLIRAFRDMGKNLGGNTLVYTRPKSKKSQGTKPKAKPRRPFVGYTLSVKGDPEEARSEVYSDANGLEMNIDDEWPIDTVLLCPPESVKVITRETDVTKVKSVSAGAMRAPANGKIKAIHSSGGRWLLLDCETDNTEEQLSAAVNAKLNIICVVRQPLQIRSVYENVPKLMPKQLVVALQPERKNVAANTAQKIVADIRGELTSHGLGDSRIVLAAPLHKNNVVKYIKQPDIDGVLLYDSDYSSVLEILVEISQHR